MGQEAPDFFRDERHERMEQLEHVLEAHYKSKPYDFLVLLIVAPEPWLYQFYIPVAVFVPDQVVNFLTSQSQVVFFHGFGHIFNCFVYLGDHPLVFVPEGDVGKIRSVAAGFSATVCTAPGHFPEIAFFVQQVHYNEP